MTHFNTSLKNQKTDVFNKNAFLACQHFLKTEHNLQKKYKVHVNTNSANTKNSKGVLQNILSKREQSWTKTSETSHPHRLNQDLNPEYLIVFAPPRCITKT